MDGSKFDLPLLLLLTITTTLSSVPLLFTPAQAYTNYTVGGSLGWYDPTVKSDVNYDKWASGKNFSLGDFLVFNTDTNHSVVQTYNETTYKLCDYEDALDKDTIQWASSDPSNTATHPVSVSVPLVREGPNYFFSADYDGDQCRSGQRFKINVTHGQGLPKDEASAPVSAVSGDDESAPDTIVPSNFNNPKEEPDDDKGDSSGAGVLRASYLVMLGFVFIFVIG